MRSEASELYPSNPGGLPADLTAATSAYRRHAWLAFGGLLVFIAVYVGLTGYLGWIVYRLLSDAFTGGNWVFGILLSILPAFFLAFLVRGLFVVKHRGDPSQVEVTAADQPELLAFVNRIADDAGAPRPHRVFLSARVNAAVFYDLSFWNLLLPSRKNLVIGLGLVQILTLDELKAVMAHEFGHFAQKTLAVSRWVYVAEQIGGHIVASRGWMDRLMQGLSYTDIRIAWIGWILRLLAWALRSVLDTAWRLVVLTHRALSRERELQADLVAVSLSGSDSLIHALYRLGPADDAWDRAVRFAAGEIDQKRPVADLFAVQGRILEHLREVLCDDDLGRVPERPRAAREAHRVFKEAVAMPPRMWSTHPPNREREDNAKLRYVPSVLDARSGWELFRDAEAVRRRVTRTFFDAGAPDPVVEAAVPMSESLERVDADFSRPVLERRYRGVYLGRSSVGCAKRVADLYRDVREKGAESILRAVDDLYPPRLTDDLGRFFDLSDEKVQLQALQDGVLDAPGGVIKYRGEEIPKKRLTEVVEKVEAERAAAEEVLLAHDRSVRSLHRAAARELGPAWERYHASLVELLHYSDHVSANVRDAHGYLLHAVDIVLVDGHVSGNERRWLVESAGDLHDAMLAIFASREWLLAPPAVEEILGDLWAEFLDRDFDLPPAAEYNLGDWLGAIDSWIFATCVPLERASSATLEVLLDVEDHIVRCLREGTDPGDPPPSASVPDRYDSFVEGEGRERQKRLGWWDRFIAADGFVPGALRLVVASAVLVPALMLGTLALGDATVHVYNGLGIPVEVSVGEVGGRVLPRGMATFDVPAEGATTVSARTSDGREIESFDAEIDHSGVDYAYNVAGAAPLLTWQAYYDSSGGGNSDGRSLGAPRFLTTDADAIFREPPASVSTSSSSSRATRDVLTGVGEYTAGAALSYVEDTAQRGAMITAHVRFDSSRDPHLLSWLLALEDPAERDRFIAERLAQSPLDVFWLTMERDFATVGEEAVCERHRQRLAEEPDAVALLYAVNRCVEDDATRGVRWLELHRDHPGDPWLAVAAGYERASRGEWAESEPLLGRGRAPEMGGLWPNVALTLARVRRVSAPTPADARLDDLIAGSGVLSNVLFFEADVAPTPEAEALVRPWRALANGDLAQAVAGVGADVENQRALLRMAAASEGVMPGVAADAWALADDEGIDPLTVWSTMAAAAREGRDWSPFAELANTFERPGQVAQMTRIITEGLERDDPGVVDAVAATLPPGLRGHAFVMGIVIFGDRAPEAWRSDARALLFARERPYFRESRSNPNSTPR